MTYSKKTLSEIKLIHGDFGNFIKGQKLDKRKEKKYKTPPYKDLAASNEIDGEPLDEKCWPGYEKKGMKTMFGKRYPNCVKKKKTKKEEFSDWRSELEQIEEKKMTKAQIKKRDEIADAISTKDMKDRYGDKNVKYAIATKLAMKEGVGSIAKGAIKFLAKKAKKYPAAAAVGLGAGTGANLLMMKKEVEKNLPKKDKSKELFYKEDNIQEILDKKDIPHVKKLVGKLRKGSKTHAKQADDLEKAMKENTAIENELVIQDWNVDDIKFTEIETVDIIKAKPLKESMSNWREELGEDWQKVNRKDKTDGLSRKAVKAYRRENPGSKLQTAVTKDPKKLKKGSKSAKRRLSFCRRMKGMKKKLTSAKTRRDPDSRINKALRRWNC